MSESEMQKNQEGVLDCLHWSWWSTWFDWEDGSQLYFWRWPSDIWQEARDGTHIFHKYLPPPWSSAQVVKVEPWMQELMNKKLHKFLMHCYLTPVPWSVIHVPIVYFPVKKGKDDIHVVWSKTETGVNDSVFAPRFFLPCMGTFMHWLPNDAWIEDFDIGEEFHNFFLPEGKWPNHGVLLPKIIQDEFDTEAAMWAQLLMGFKPSPYCAGWLMSHALESAKGHPSDKASPFHFTLVLLNLPRSPDYKPSLSIHVIKLDSEGKVTGECVIYVDDGQGAGWDEMHVKACTRYVCSQLEHLGIQDAKRKHQPGSQCPGAWIGSVVFTDQNCTHSFLSQKCWSKARELIVWLSDQYKKYGGFDFTPFGSARGFLVYVSFTYNCVIPFLKGIHLTADAWRPGQDSEGWKIWKATTRPPPILASAPLPDDMHHYLENLSNEPDDEDVAEKFWDEWNHFDDPDFVDSFQTSVLEQKPPQFLKAVPWVHFDLAALHCIFESEMLLMVPHAGLRVTWLVYGFGDASREGFGSKLLAQPIQQEQPLLELLPTQLWHGFWCTTISERSSNYQEFRNLVEAIKDWHQTQGLEGAEVWIYTDNMVTEMVFYKGMSDDPNLFYLMLDLKLLALNASFTLHIVHVAGTQMINEGTDGLSHGELHLGTFFNSLAQIVPLHLGALEHSPALLDWIKTWVGPDQSQLHVAQPVDWPYEAHLPKNIWVWAPPPAAVLYVMEEIGMAHLKHADSLCYIVIMLLLMKPEWFHQFSHVVDVYFVIQPWRSFWWKDMHEPILIGLSFPLLRHDPWSWKAIPFMVGLGHMLSGLHKEDSLTRGDILCKFWAAHTWVAAMPKSMVHSVLSQNSFNTFLSLSGLGWRWPTFGFGWGSWKTLLDGPPRRCVYVPIWVWFLSVL